MVNRGEKPKVLEIEERLALIQKLIGTKFTSDTLHVGPKGMFVLRNASSDNLRRWADGIGDLNPRFRDSDYAQRTKYGHLVAQPMFLVAVCHPTGGAGVTNIPGARSFHSSSEWEFFKPILEGDVIDYHGIQVENARIKSSKFGGKMIIINGLMQYRNQRGEIVAMVRGFLHQSASNEATLSVGKYDENIKPYRYSDEELRKIEEDKQKEEMRGMQPRYWEHVSEDESIGLIVIGPHTLGDIMAYDAGGTSPHVSSRMPVALPPELGTYDPETNTKVTVIGVEHFNNNLSKNVGAPGSFDVGAERESLISILFTNWMGDDGFLWKYSTQFRSFVIDGDTCWYTGKIVKKYVDDGKYCVDIDHWGTNQRGEKVTVGKATVILPSILAGQVKYPTPRYIEDVLQKTA